MKKSLAVVKVKKVAREYMLLKRYHHERPAAFDLTKMIV